MNYQETLEYLYAKLPMFTRQGAVAIRPGLKNIELFSKQLKNPEKKFKTIHVGGTNGKGSTSHMLAAIFQNAGYKTALYTSPHLSDFRERIRINGSMIPEEKVIEFVEEQKEFIESIQPSYFEVTVAMAFNYFASEQVDIAIIEVGLGGRLDSTNIIMPELSIITNISKDHTHLLGNTLEEIAAEKAGIIKQNIPVIIGEYHPKTAPVFIEKAESCNSAILFASKTLRAENILQNNQLLQLDILKEEEIYLETLALDLTGSYQAKNVLAVLLACQILNKNGWKLEDRTIRNALKQVKKETGLQGRWQQLSENPAVYCDTGHNEAGIAEVLQNIASVPYQQLHMVIGMVKDKDISTVLSMLPTHAHYYFCNPNMERALEAETLKTTAADFNLIGEAYPTVQLAYQAALHTAHKNDLIFIGGSTFVVAEIL